MKIRKIALRGAAVATAVLSVTALTAGSASAAPEQCEPGYFCMWENNAYTGRIYALRNADSPNFGDFFNDKMTSYWNRSNHTYVVFEHVNYGGTCLHTIRPGESTSAVPTWANDLASSARRWRAEDAFEFCQG